METLRLQLRARLLWTSAHAAAGRTRVRNRIHAGVAALTGLLALTPGLATAQIADPNLWSTNGSVYASVLHGNTLYIGGTFTYVGPRTGGFAAIDPTSGTLQAGWPRIDGWVDAVAADGAGGWYIAGNFTSVAGVSRQNLAHIRANGSLDGWNPGANEVILALAVSGNTVYAGGTFSSIGGQPRSNIAALDAKTGLATEWNPDASGGIAALAVSGNTVYAGGYFSTIGGETRSSIAALDAKTGQATAWNPGPSDYFSVNALAVSGNTVYAGGWYGSIGGQARSHIAALDATTGQATAWNPMANDYGPVHALAVSGNTVYAGGGFTRIGGQLRNRIAALDAKTGLATEWNPDASGGIAALAVSGNTVYAGGGFTDIGGQARSNIAALDATTGRATAWNPGAGGIPYSHVSALAVGGNTVYAGGYFTNSGGQVRSHIAALDAKTGVATAWNPNAGGAFVPDVYALAVSGNTVYAGGRFSSIGGQARSFIAALDATTGQATGWDAAANNEVFTLVVTGSIVYAGGYFKSIGGQPFLGIARLLPTPPYPADALASHGGGAVLSGTTRLATSDATTEARGTQAMRSDPSRTVPEPVPVAKLALGSPVPNPVRAASAVVAYAVPQRMHVRLTVLDVQGREVAVLVDEEREVGRHTASLAASRLQPGLYFLRLQASGVDLSCRVAIVR